MISFGPSRFTRLPFGLSPLLAEWIEKKCLKRSFEPRGEEIEEEDRRGTFVRGIILVIFQRLAAPLAIR